MCAFHNVLTLNRPLRKIKTTSQKFGDPGLGHADLAKKFGIELVNGKLPKGMEGFLAQKIGGKVGVIGAGINGTGTDWPISNGGKKVAEAFFK